MKKLHLLMLKSYLGPFLGSFSIALFVLTLQFLAKYQNDIFGKGFGAAVITQLFMYTSVQLSVMALPLAILMASIMSLGKLGENYELAALKATGVSLFRIISPLIWATLLLTGVSFMLSSFAVPKANLKLYSLLYDVQRANPEFAIRPGHFENNIKGFTIYTARRSEEGRLYGIKIWDHLERPGDLILFAADSADMSIDEKTQYLILSLFHGARYEERQTDANRVDTKYPYSRLYFDTLIYKLDLSGFGLHKTDETMFGSHHYMLTFPKLITYVDSMKKEPQETANNMRFYLKPFIEPDTLSKKIYNNDTFKIQSAVAYFEKPKQRPVLQKALNNARNIKNNIEFSRSMYKNKWSDIRKYQAEMYNKITFPLACLVFLFIGAPLGAIIRKGGLGAPTLAAIFFFIVYWVLMTQGKKLAREGVVEVWIGVFLPILVMFPVSIYITYQAATDSRLFDLSAWRILYENLKKR